jgi:hypothetical protein
MGSGEYRDGRRNAWANANCFANACIKRYSVRGGNTNSYCDRNCYDTTIPDAYPLVTGIAYPAAIPDAYTYREYTSQVTHANPHGDGPAQGNTEASADSTSSSVRIC